MRALWLCLALATSVPAQAPAANSPSESQTFKNGALTPRVICAAKPEQSYALYLPSNYSPQRAWPIVYAFDPGARGTMPVELLLHAAEKYGYIVVGSHNSRNGPSQVAADAMQAMWTDTHTRFSIDDRRVYLTGFSGGARMATMIARLCNGCAAGLIAHGAGFMEAYGPDKQTNFSYFATIGERDFNFTEVVELGEQLEKLGVPHRVRRFDGGHQWAPAEIWIEAIEWMELRAMKENRRPRGEAFITAQLKLAADRAAGLERAGNLYAAFAEYQQLSADFQGLADTGPSLVRARELEGSAAVREGRKNEKRDHARYFELVSGFVDALEQMRVNADARQQIAMRLRGRLLNLASEAEKSKDTPAGLVAARALGNLNANLIESSQLLIEKKDYDTAIAFLELLTQAQPKQPGPFFALARACALAGRKKCALSNLSRAADNGLSATALERFLGDFASVAQEKDFLALRDRLKKAT